MAEKFDPAPKDKHAADPKQARKADKEMHGKLDKGLEGTFPASDPVSTVQPAKIEAGCERRLISAEGPSVKVRFPPATDSKQHPPTSVMNKAMENTATSSEGRPVRPSKAARITFGRKPSRLQYLDLQG
jgi:hypothetical protein